MFVLEGRNEPRDPSHVMLGPSFVPKLPIKGMSMPWRRHRIWKDIPSLGHSEPLDACRETADGHYLCHLTHTTRPRLYSLMSLWWTWEHPFCLSWLFHPILSVGIVGAHKWWRRFLSLLFGHILGIVELRFCREMRFDPSANIGCSLFSITWYYCKKCADCLGSKTRKNSTGRATFWLCKGLLIIGSVWKRCPKVYFFFFLVPPQRHAKVFPLRSSVKYMDRNEKHWRHIPSTFTYLANSADSNNLRIYTNNF